MQPAKLCIQLALFVTCLLALRHVYALFIEFPDRLFTITAPANSPLPEPVLASVSAWIVDGAPDKDYGMTPYKTDLGVDGCGMTNTDLQRLIEGINTRTRGTKIVVSTTEMTSNPCGDIHPKLSIVLLQHGPLRETDEIAARPQRLDFWRELIGRRIGEARLGHTDAVTIGALIFAGNLGASLETSLGEFARRNLPDFQLEEAVRGLLENVGDKRMALELLTVAGVPLDRIKLVRYVPGRGWQDDR